jgi:hypothetical protein
MTVHPATGPISPELMRALADAPFGKAAEALRKHDPAWGLVTPDRPNLTWTVTLTGEVIATLEVKVVALTEGEARERALIAHRKMPVEDWEIDRYDGIENVTASAVKVKATP